MTLLTRISKRHKRKRKTWYDKKFRERVFNIGDRVLVLLPIPGEPVLELEIHSFMRCDKASNISQAQSKTQQESIVSRPTFT